MPTRHDSGRRAADGVTLQPNLARRGGSSSRFRAGLVALAVFLFAVQVSVFGQMNQAKPGDAGPVLPAAADPHAGVPGAPSGAAGDGASNLALDDMDLGAMYRKQNRTEFEK